MKINIKFIQLFIGLMCIACMGYMFFTGGLLVKYVCFAGTLLSLAILVEWIKGEMKYKQMIKDEREPRN